MGGNREVVGDLAHERHPKSADPPTTFPDARSDQVTSNLPCIDS